MKRGGRTTPNRRVDGPSSFEGRDQVAVSPRVENRNQETPEWRPRSCGGRLAASASLTSTLKPKAGGPHRLAVVPLMLTSSHPHDDYLAVGLTEEMTSVLSQVRGLRVISHAAVDQVRIVVAAGDSARSDFGVDSTLDGDVSRNGSRLGVAARFTPNQSDQGRSVRTIDFDLGSACPVRGLTAERSVTASYIGLDRLEREAIRMRPTSNLAAYEAYLRGIQGFRKLYSGSRSDGRIGLEARGFFEYAIRADPRFSTARAYLANLLLAVMGVIVTTVEVVAPIREHVARALELSPSSADAHAARGNLAMQADLDWKRAEVEFREALTLNPSSSTAHFWYGDLLSLLQRYPESKKHYRIAHELDPLWVLPLSQLAWVYAFSGDLASAIEVAEGNVHRHPDSDFLRVELAWFYAFADRAADAIRLVEPMADVPSLYTFWNPVAVLAYLGRPDGARKMLANSEPTSTSRHFPPADAAALYALIGEDETAFAQLEQESREGERIFWPGYQGPWFDAIRDETRFGTLLHRQGLPSRLVRPLKPGYCAFDAPTNR